MVEKWGERQYKEAADEEYAAKQGLQYMTAKWKWIPMISGALVALLAGQTRLQAADARAGLRDYLKKEMRELRIPGMQVAEVRHQKIVFLAALGIAEFGNAVPVTNKTVFPIASSTKAFAGVALMQLVENSKLELGAPRG